MTQLLLYISFQLPINFSEILAGEGSASMSPPTAVSIDDNFAPSQTGVAL